MQDVVEILREITKDQVTVSISVFLKSGIVRRSYTAKLDYSEEEDNELPYIHYRAVFDNVEGETIRLSGTSPYQILESAFRVVSKDARKFSSSVLKSNGMRSKLRWPIYGFANNKYLVSSY